jgi:hypothetical protein
VTAATVSRYRDPAGTLPQALAEASERSCWLARWWFPCEVALARLVCSRAAVGAVRGLLVLGCALAALATVGCGSSASASHRVSVGATARQSAVRPGRVPHTSLGATLRCASKRKRFCRRAIQLWARASEYARSHVCVSFVHGRPGSKVLSTFGVLRRTPRTAPRLGGSDAAVLYRDRRFSRPVASTGSTSITSASRTPPTATPTRSSPRATSTRLPAPGRAATPRSCGESGASVGPRHRGCAAAHLAWPPAGAVSAPVRRRSRAWRSSVIRAVTPQPT